MSDALNTESSEYKSEISEVDCKASSTNATAGDSFRSIDCIDVSVRRVCFVILLLGFNVRDLLVSRVTFILWLLTLSLDK